MTPKERAEKSAAAMWSPDRASKWMGMTLEDVDEGSATMSLEVQHHHCNGLGICHGGVTFSLADSTFAFACNSRNQSTVAQQNAITFLAPGYEGDTLTATAREISLRGKNGIYDITVTNQKGETIALVRGHSRAIKGQLFDETAEETT